MSEPLARGVIEIGIDDVKLQAEVNTGQSTLAKSFRETMNRTRITQNEMQKLSKLNRDLKSVDMERVRLAETQQRTTQRLAQTSQFHLSVIKKLTSEWQVITRFANQENAPKKSMLDRVKGAWGKGQTIAGAAMAGGTAVSGLAFAGAAMAGSTTLDTLTGSLKHLGLVIGGKVQPAIIGLSKWIQGMSSTARGWSLNDITSAAGLVTGASVGARLGGFQGAVLGGGLGLGAGLAFGGNKTLGWGMAGASIGAMYGGVPGAITGASLGGLAGTVASTKFRGEYIEDIATSFLRDPARAGRALGVAAKLEKQAEGLSGDQRGSTQNAARWIREALAKSEAMRAAGLGDQFKTSGLNMPASYAGLADVHQQAQMSLFSMGPLEMKNWLEEMKNNVAAIAQGNQQGGNVAPPSQ